MGNNFKLPPINKIELTEGGNTNRFYKKDKLKMAKMISKGEKLIENNPMSLDMNIIDESAPH